LITAALVLTFWVEPCARPVEMACRPEDADLAVWALEAWAKASGGALQFVREAREQQALFRFYWAGARPGLYGEARPIEVKGKRGAELYIRPAVAPGGDRLLRDVIVYLTCLHESGHGLGLGHTRDFDDIMYSFQFGGDLDEYFARWRRKLKSRDELRSMGGYSPSDQQRLQRAIANWNAF
jgi:hypothetical protein